MENVELQLKDQDVEEQLQTKQQKIQDSLDSQQQLYQQIQELTKTIKQFSEKLNSLKSEEYQKMQITKASDVIQLDIRQIMKNKNLILQSIKNQNLSKIAIETQIVDNSKEQLNIIQSEQIVYQSNDTLLNNMLVLITDNKLFEAIEYYNNTYQKLIVQQEINSQQINMSFYIKFLSIREQLIKELKMNSSMVELTQQFEIKDLDQFCKSMLQIGSSQDVLEIILNYFSKFIRQKSREMNPVDKFQFLLEQTLLVIFQINQNYSKNIQQFDYCIQVSKWLTEEFQFVLTEFKKQFQDKNKYIQNLEKLKIDLNQFEIKGVCMNFLIDIEIYRELIN